jgi:hypothetical protein
MATITVRSHTGEPEARRAQPTPTPGLWVTEALWEGRRSWSITHKRSGLAIAFFTSPEAALAAAIDLDGVLPWTLSGQEVHRPLGHPDLVKVWRIVGRYDGFMPDGPAPPEHRADLPEVAR